MVGDRTIADRAVATDRIRGAIHDIRQLYGLDVPIPKEPTPAVPETTPCTYRRCQAR